MVAIVIVIVLMVIVINAVVVVVIFHTITQAAQTIPGNYLMFLMQL